jgi:hypothetical protein
MQHSDFILGGTFWCGGRTWQCTDIGTRTIVASRIDRVDVDSTTPDRRRTLDQSAAEADGWFNGPPYAVAETVFDEYDIEGCTPEAPVLDAEAPDVPDDAARWSTEAAAACIAQASALRAQARAGGLRFGAYLPPDLADWILDAVERGVFTDPAEAVFVILTEHGDLEPHADLRQELMRRAIQAALDDPRPGIPHEQVMAMMQQWAAAPRPEPAVWRWRKP